MSTPGEVGFWRGEVDNLHNDIEGLENVLKKARRFIVMYVTDPFYGNAAKDVLADIDRVLK